MEFTRLKIKNFFNLNNVDLDLNKGNTLIVGPNGSGKTNITKCVQFLVNGILEKYHGKSADQDEELQEMWKPYKECSIEVLARFGQAGLELFSRLRVVCLMAELCNFVFAVIGFLSKCFQMYYKQEYGSDSDDDDHDPFMELNVQRQKELFESLPKEIQKLIKSSIVSDDYETTTIHLPNELSFQFLMTLKGPHELITDFVKKVFPKLISITRSQLPKDQTERSNQESHVRMTASTLDSGKLDFFFDISDSTWLPDESKRQQEFDVISDALKEMFGTKLSEHVKFLIHRGDTEDEPLESCFHKLLDIECSDVFTDVSVYPDPESNEPNDDYDCPDCSHGPDDHYCVNWRGRKSLMDIKVDKDGWILNDQKFRAILRETAWSAELSSCLKKLNQKEWQVPRKMGKEDFLKHAAAHCLAESAKTFILPQNREGALEQSDMVVTMESLNELLVTSKLSEHEWSQKQFGKVKDGMMSFCGIEIDVRQKKREVIPGKDSSKELKALGTALVALSEVNHPLRSVIVQEVSREAPSWSGQLAVVFKRTSPYSYESSQSGLSRGELEMLMVLCAIHLSPAGTVFLDEPGHCLHPPQQAQLRRWIETLRYPDPVCVVITHSVEFISREFLSSLYHMSFVEDGFTSFKLAVESSESSSGDQGSVLEGTLAGQSTQPSNPPPSVALSSEVITELMRPDMRKMFFASGVYFVEGETDKLVLSALRYHLLQKARAKEEDARGEPHLQDLEVLEMDRWDVLALGGCGNAMKAYKASADLKIPCALVLDADAITVKAGSKVLPVTSDRWKKSMLYRTLTKEAKSLEVAETLLNKIGAAFKEEQPQSDVQDEIRKILQKHGIWVWKGDLESEVCDNHRDDLNEMEDLMEVLGELSLTPGRSISTRGNVSVEDALRNYDVQVVAPLESLMDTVRVELDSARDRIRENPSRRVTKELQSLVGQFKALKQSLEKHDNFCEKGSKRTADKPNSGPGPSKKKFSSEPALTSQEQLQDLPLDVEMPPDLAKISWDRVKRKLHSGGWGKLPWKILVKMMEVCIEDEGSSLREFCEFMKRCQSKSMN